MRYLHLDVFTDRPFEGNQLAVFPEPAGLDAALMQLAPAARLCVVLAYHEGLSHSEISATTSIPLGTVKSHVTRGAARLRQILKDYQ